MRRATLQDRARRENSHISIHALLAESDVNDRDNVRCHSQFLSTLSLRRATSLPNNTALSGFDFYPRSPCGERLILDDIKQCAQIISIHALLAESDLQWTAGRIISAAFLSTLSLRRATTSRLHKILADWDFYPRSPCGERPFPSAIKLLAKQISIHALLAESDDSPLQTSKWQWYFYPRSPCGERHGDGTDY